MALAISLTFLQVVMRYVFDAPIYWTEEVVLYAIIVVSFVGISIGIRLGSHISVDLLDAFVPEKYVPALHAIAIALIYYGGKLFLPPLSAVSYPRLLQHDPETDFIITDSTAH